MKEVTSYMYNNYGLKKMKCDFMGYTFKRKEDLSFHHLIIPNREGGAIAVWNGAILNGFTSHPYLHRIESRDEEIFYLITNEMIDQNIKGYLDIDNLKKIRDLLEYFEREHCSDVTSKGKRLIKEEYIRNRIKL